MKKLMFLMAACLVLLTACNKATTTTEEAVAVSSLPAAVTESVANNYPDAAIASASRVLNGATDYILVLNTQEEVAFKSSGECQGDAAQFRGEGNRGGHRGGGGDGPGRPGGQGHHGVGGRCGRGFPVDSLNTAIKSYIATNYSSYTIRHAELDTLCSVGAVISVGVSQAGLPPVRLIFSATSFSYLMQGERTEYATIPTAVQTYITANYANFSQRKRAIKLTLANGDLEYMIFMHQAGQRKNVLLKADGTFICGH